MCENGGMAEPNWNKHSALSGWANVLVAICAIVVMLYLGLRQPLQASQPNVATTGNPGVGPVMPQWLPWVAASLYAAGVIVAGILHLKAARLTTNSAQSDEVGGLREQTNGCNARDGIITGLREQIKSLNTAREQELQRAAEEASKPLHEQLGKLQAEQARSKRDIENWWSLKSEALEIKRLWPGSDFEGRPANKKSWVLPHSASGSVSKSVEDRGWLERALRWREQFQSYQFLIQPNDFLLNTLTCDELMELLDADQMAKAGLLRPVPRPNRPIIRARYGQSKDGHSYGFLVKNIRDDPAFNVSIVALRIGSKRVLLRRTLANLDRDQGEQYIELYCRDYEGGRDDQL